MLKICGSGECDIKSGEYDINIAWFSHSPMSVVVVIALEHRRKGFWGEFPPKRKNVMTLFTLNFSLFFRKNTKDAY